MPGLDFYKTESHGTTALTVPVTPVEETRRASARVTPSPETPLKTGAYYNARLDPKNFLEGPLSWDPATRLRQMLARPGIVVRTSVCFVNDFFNLIEIIRLHLVFATVSAPVVRLRQASTACTRAELLPQLPV